MRKIIFILLIVTCGQVFAWQKKDTSYLTKEELLGTWQRGTKITGNGLNQHFIFKSDGSFVLNLYNDGDDARSLIGLKGKYRLLKDKLYLTITSRKIVEGELGIGDMALTSSLLEFGPEAKAKEVKEINPKEMLDPCYITTISRTNIKLNNQNYYKIKK